MKKIKFSREIRVGIMAIAAIFLLYFGLNFLKGVDIFTPVNYFYATYDDIDGLVPSSPVYIKGYKVGQVESVTYDFKQSTPFVVKISVTKDIQVPQTAQMELFDDGLMGGKAVQIVNILPFAQSDFYHSGDTLVSSVSVGLLGQLAGDLMPKVEDVLKQADSLMFAVRSLVESDNIKKSLASIELTTAELASSSIALKKLMNQDMPGIVKNVQLITDDFKNVSASLSKVDFETTFQQLDLTIRDLNQISHKINAGDGSLGLLLNDKRLYINLLDVSKNADKLLIDLKEHPKRYVNFSLFGSKEK